MSQPIDILKKYWGYDSFRPLQEDIINSVLSGSDTLGLMPTGGGKSITFQVPGLMSGGLTLVITPLISLMKDQVDNLRDKGIKAVCLYSGLSSREHRLADQKIRNGGCKFLYIAPERLASPKFLNDLRTLDIRFIVVDEAHCISQWGYDFRPAYLNIASVRKIIPNAPVLALTATATPDVANDICRNLLMRNPAIFKMSFTRDNIQYIVRPADDKFATIRHILSNTSGSSIVYVRSRKRTKEISDFLNSFGITSTFYHARLDPEEKELRQEGWRNGRWRVIVATNAFGMGIDKPDVRVVIHHDLPPSLEEYYQEAGRAGRDGKRSFAVLITSKPDKGVLRRRIAETFPPREDILKIYERICNFLNISVGEGYGKLYEFSLDTFCDTFDLKEKKVLAALKILSGAGYMDFLDDVDSRARMMVICDRRELYELEVNDDAEIVFETVLRHYPGLFADYVYISEKRIADALASDVERVYECLLELGRRGYIHYVPRRKSSLISLPTSREEPKYLVIGKAVYEDRKKRFTTRIDSMIDYAFNSAGCRVRRMLDYFGEENGKDCGGCDVCIEKRRKKSKILDMEENIDLVKGIIKCYDAGVDFSTIVKKSMLGVVVVKDILERFLEEEVVAYDKGCYRLRDKI